MDAIEMCACRDAQAAMHAGMPTDGAAHSSSLAAGAAPALASGSAVLTWAMSSLMSSTGGCGCGCVGVWVWAWV
eukprot:343042-Pelagomonas_calceolata.AAC.2